jgi:Kef-type K+ transport system membrane component KefB
MQSKVSNQAFMNLIILLAGMFLASYLLHFPLAKYRMPTLLAPLFVGFVFQLLPGVSSYINVANTEQFGALSQMGVIFLLLTVGVQLDVKTLLSLGRHIVLLSVLNLGLSTILGYIVLIQFGYPPLISFVVSTALATVAETTIAPILDELGVITSMEACLILSPGVVDDVVEIIIASLASVVVGSGEFQVTPLSMLSGFTLFAVLALVLNRVILPALATFEGNPSDPSLLHLLLSSTLVLVVVSMHFRLGVLLGSIVAGLTFQRFLSGCGAEKRTLNILRILGYGLLGPIFFFGVGLVTDLSNMAESIPLTILLITANFVGKFLAAFITGKLIGLSLKSMIIVGLGLSAKFSMGIIPVQIFFSAGVIDEYVFSSFVAVSTITTIIIPFSLAYLINKWRDELTSSSTPLAFSDGT